GTTDFIFGEATALFENCIIKSLANSYITTAARSPNQKFGYVLLNCKLIADTAAKKCYLGRPWRPNAKTVFINTEMENHIVLEGWNNWGNLENEKSVFYAEYNNKGSGANLSHRAIWSKQLKLREAKQFTIENIFSGRNAWKPTL
ncbi:MAG TPA: pectinesterase family protein, partial [Chitinophagaceae bacterium]|nr:pectinesterase family protein [Chitinophagaceae bacterium]